MELFLEEPTIAHQQAFEEMMDEWEMSGVKIFPSVIRRADKKSNRKICYTEF